MEKYLSILVAVLLLVGCQEGATVRDENGANSFSQLQGASIVLNQDLSVDAGKARVFVQGGDVSYGFDSYKPHCGFEIDSVRHDGTSIQADTFVISRVQGLVQPVVTIPSVQVASLQLAGGMDGGGGSQSYYEGYHFWLTSANQPEVRRMSCFGVYAQPYELYPPTLAEIRQALGSVATIQR